MTNIKPIIFYSEWGYYLNCINKLLIFGILLLFRKFCITFLKKSDTNATFEKNTKKSGFIGFLEDS